MAIDYAMANRGPVNAASVVLGPCLGLTGGEKRPEEDDGERTTWVSEVGDRSRLEGGDVAEKRSWTTAPTSCSAMSVPDHG